MSMIWILFGIFLFVGITIAFFFLLELALLWYFFATGKVILGNFMLRTLKFFGKALRIILRKDLDMAEIKIANILNKERFKDTPKERRAIFLPQCLRHRDCPAKLNPEGIQCIRCSRCGIGSFLDKTDTNGSLVFIVPGSSFIKRMIKEYQPEAILGVGCILEVKEGIELFIQHKIPVIGVVLTSDGCVGTDVAWKDVESAAAL